MCHNQSHWHSCVKRISHVAKLSVNYLIDSFNTISLKQTWVYANMFEISTKILAQYIWIVVIEWIDRVKKSTTHNKPCDDCDDGLVMVISIVNPTKFLYLHFLRNVFTFIRLYFVLHLYKKNKKRINIKVRVFLIQHLWARRYILYHSLFWLPLSVSLFFSFFFLKVM